MLLEVGAQLTPMERNFLLLFLSKQIQYSEIWGQKRKKNAAN